MRFSTKILLLTLAITLGLSGIVVLVVRSQVTRKETQDANDAIAGSSGLFFERLKVRQENAGERVADALDDPTFKSLLDSFAPDATADARSNAQEQFGLFFRGELYEKLRKPSFQVLVDARGRTLVATAPTDPGLERALADNQVQWRVEQALHTQELVRQYLWVQGKLYLMFVLPLRQTTDEDPNFAYFCGFHVTDEWLRELLANKNDKTAVVTWFIVDGKIVAGASNLPTPLTSSGQRLASELGRFVSNSGPDSLSGVTINLGEETLIAQYSVFDPSPNTRLVVAAASSLDEKLKDLRVLLRQLGIVTLGVVVLAVIAAKWISRRLAKPVEQLVEGTRHIARGDFTHTIDTRRSDELGELARSFNEMSLGLAQRDLIKDTLGQFVDPRIADALLTNPASLRGQRVVQSVLFSDLEKFTAMSERLAPEQLVAVLNRFLGASADVVKELNGYLDKFTGDGVIAFWGPPVERDHALAACRAALRMVELTKQFTDPPLHVRIGIATGEVLVGIVGSESSKKNYTAMGDVVNLASRLEGVNKEYGTQILIDATTAGAVSGSISTRRIGVVQVRGREEPVEIFEVT